MTDHDQKVEQLLDQQSDSGSTASNSQDLDDIAFDLQLQNKIDASLTSSMNLNKSDEGSHSARMMELIRQAESVEKVEQVIDQPTTSTDTSTSDSPDQDKFAFDIQLQNKIDASLTRSMESEQTSSESHSARMMELIRQAESAEKVEQALDQQSDANNTIAGDSQDQEEIAFDLQLQSKIDASLARSMASGQLSSESHNTQMMDSVRKTAPKPKRQGLPKSRLWVLAASILIMVSVAYWQAGNSNPDTGGVFVPQPLAMLFEDTVERGFKPYYVCDEPDRFAQQFQDRQGTPLRLLPMPEKQRMVGIAYLGGISREATAMLGLVDEQPVLVFVDRFANDNEKMRQQVGKTTDGYYVSRVSKDGLVFYEVSSFETPQFVDYLEIVKPQE